MDPLLDPAPTEDERLFDRLCRAARDGDIDRMRALLAEGAQVDRFPGEALKAAVDSGRAAATQWLLENGADVNASCAIPRDEPALYVAVRRGDPESMSILLAAGADVRERRGGGEKVGGRANGCTALQYAVHSRAKPARCAELLLAYGAPPDDSGDPRMTPLWFAIWNGRRDLVKILLRAGARMIAVADLPNRRSANASAFEVLDAVRAAGGWPEYVVAHRRVLAGLVSKLSTRRPLRLDAASRVVAFLCPDGGF